MGELNHRKVHEHLIKTNLHRLSNETVAKIVEEIEDEVEQSIIKELEEE